MKKEILRSSKTAQTNWLLVRGKQYCKNRLFIIFILVTCSLGCNLFSGKVDETEMVFAATEVGTPEGDKVTKDIGPAGGTVASPDGRFTLTVPPGALTKTDAFSIQPITNKAGNGLGLAYRLEPDGKTFATPLDISVRYDEKDLEGTIPEALSLAYQDKQGAWHAQKSAKLDQAAKTLTISTTHFTDVATFARLRMLPSEATVRVRTTKHIQVVLCGERGFWDKILLRPTVCSQIQKDGNWALRGPGRLDRESYLHGINYWAPLKKPRPNIAWVDWTGNLTLWDRTTGETSSEQKTFSAKITIIDRGYRATGQTADLKYSGVVCDLEKPFTISGSVINYKFQFTPSSATAGTVTISGAGFAVKAEGGGTYTIEGADTDKPRIALAGNVMGHTPIGSQAGSGTVYIDLIPLETNECNEEN